MSKPTGDMYDWVTRTWNPVGGECPINCPYCYVKDLKRFPVMAAKYSGEPRLTGPWPKFKKGEVVFVCSCTDLFAMPSNMVEPVLNHCRRRPDATYVFQSKVPAFMRPHLLPPSVLLGTTIETDLLTNDIVGNRVYALRSLRFLRDSVVNTFVTVEPIQRFSGYFADTLMVAKPSFVNIGADSGGNHLPEPSKAEVLQLIADLRAAGIEVRVKKNLRRIIGKEMTP